MPSELLHSSFPGTRLMFKRACPRLIEVGLPIREISAEAVRDKSFKHGHVSTLHPWWARRPLAASRTAVEQHLKTQLPAPVHRPSTRSLKPLGDPEVGHE